VSTFADTAAREFLHIRRDRVLPALVILAPAALTILFGYAFESSAITGIPLLVVDDDDSEISRSLVEGWAGVVPPGSPAQMFQLTVEARTAGGRDRARHAMDGRFRGAVHIPAGFGAALKATDPGALRRQTITLFVDGSDTVSGMQAMVVLRESITQFNRRASEKLWREEVPKHIPFPPLRKLLTPELTDALIELVALDQKEPLFNPKLNFLSYVLPGVMGMVLQLMTVTLIAGSIAREREEGTLEQLAVSPVRPGPLLAGKAVPYFFLAIFDVVCVWVVGALLFGVKPNGSWWQLSVCALLFVPATLGPGMLIGAIARTRMQAVQAAIFYLMPGMMLSGAYGPLDSIPESVRWVSNLFALTFYCRAFRDVWFHDAGMARIWPDLTALAVFGLLAFAAAVAVFRMRRG
jgi:ABC-2 type transport system permease protein